MKIISSFTHPQVFSNLYECSAEHNTDFHRGGGGGGGWGGGVGGGGGGGGWGGGYYGAPELKEFPNSSEYLPLCSAEQRHSYKFENT